jgi:hypothetical protein
VYQGICDFAISHLSFGKEREEGRGGKPSGLTQRRKEAKDAKKTEKQRWRGRNKK